MKMRLCPVLSGSLLLMAANVRCQAGDVPDTAGNDRHTIATPGLTIEINDQGAIVAASIGARKFKRELHGLTALAGSVPRGQALVRKVQDGVEFERTLEQPDAARMKMMAFRVNWKASFDFPYIGMFLPPVKSGAEKWRRFGGQETSLDAMANYSAEMRRKGGYVLRNLQNLSGRSAVEGLHPGEDQWKAMESQFRDQALHVTVPLHRRCAMMKVREVEN